MCSQLAWVLSAVSALSDAQKSRSLVLVISGLVHARRRTSHGSCFLASLTRVAAGWQHYLPRPRCCLMRNLAQLPALATFSRLDVCCEVFFFTLLPFGIFGMTSARFFFKLIPKQGMGNRSDLSMLKASGHSSSSLRDFVIWTKSL